jgi:type IV pilus assembly protein PilV
MQGLALSSTGSSRSRALAAIEASSLAAAMQANRTYWSASGTVPITFTVTTSAGTATFSGVSPAALQAAVSAVTPCGSMGTNLVSCYCTTGNAAPCTSSNLAASDLYDWGQTLAGFLPNATATVGCTTTDLPVDCTIQINWSENTVALNTQEATNTAANGSTVAVSYSLYVVP